MDSLYSGCGDSTVLLYRIRRYIPIVTPPPFIRRGNARGNPAMTLNEQAHWPVPTSRRERFCLACQRVDRRRGAGHRLRRRGCRRVAGGSANGPRLPGWFGRRVAPAGARRAADSGVERRSVAGLSRLAVRGMADQDWTNSLRWAPARCGRPMARRRSSTISHTAAKSRPARSACSNPQAPD